MTKFMHLKTRPSVVGKIHLVELCEFRLSFSSYKYPLKSPEHVYWCGEKANMDEKQYPYVNFKVNSNILTTPAQACDVTG